MLTLDGPQGPAFVTWIVLGISATALWLAARRSARVLTERLSRPDLEEAPRIDLEEALERAVAMRAVCRWLALLLPASGLVHAAVAGTSMEAHLMDGVHLVLRWTHVIAGIMWIGASFYFIFLENHLERVRDVRAELAGNLWAVHGGGFYYVEKYKGAPARLPHRLHWFKFEAYFTWLSGVSLLTLVYYADARALLIDPGVQPLSVPAALAVAIGSLIAGWAVYDALCRSPLNRSPRAFAVAGSALLAAFVFLLTHLLSGRGAFLHVGALIGTLMAGNVFFVIIPSQRALVRAARTGMPLDPELGKRAGLRSLHNNYLTLPVIFTMISPHFPATYSHPHRALVLLAIILASAVIKHYWNLLERGQRQPVLLAVGLLMLAVTFVWIAPASRPAAPLGAEVRFEEVAAVMTARCVSCHSAAPTDDVFTTAPNGVMLETPDQIRGMADRILLRAVHTETMPLANKTHMTPEERSLLERWIAQGARTDR